MAYNPRRYFPPAYFAPKFWGQGGGELPPPGAMTGTSAGTSTAFGTISAIVWTSGTSSGEATATGIASAFGFMTGTASGSSTATGILTGVEQPQDQELRLGNLGWGENFWPASPSKKKKTKQPAIGWMTGTAHGTSTATGRISARNIPREKEIVKEIIGRYEKSVALEIDNDDEETLMLMW